MSTLFLRGKSIWIGYTDQYGIRHNKPTGIKLTSVIKRNGRTIFPQTVLVYQSQLDAKIALRLPDLQSISRPKIKLSELLNEFLTTEGSQKKPSTKRMYKLAIAKLQLYFGDCYLNKINSEDLFLWRDSLLQTDRPHSVASYLRTLSPIINYAVSRGYITKSPFAKGLKMNPIVETPVIFSDSELQAVKNEIVKYPNVLTAIRLLELTGFRVGEACYLRWSDIDFLNGIISVHNSKENRFDAFPIDDTLEMFLRSISKTSEFVLSIRDRSYISHKLKETTRKLGLSEKLCVHSIRKTFCSRLVRSGVDMAIAHKLMRHRHVSTTLKYYTWFGVDTLKKGLEQSRKNLQQLQLIAK